LHSPTLVQWGCAHRWKTTTTRPGHEDIVRMRYLTCRRYGLKVKTHERLAVPWDAEDLVDQVKAWLPEGQAVALRDKGITELPLAWLNARLASYGYVIYASGSRVPKQLVECRGKGRQVKALGTFELRLISSVLPGDVNS